MNMNGLSPKEIGKKVLLGVFLLFLVVNIGTIIYDNVKDIKIPNLFPDKEKQVVTSNAEDTRDEVPYCRLNDEAIVRVRTLYDDGSEEVSELTVMPYKLLTEKKTDAILTEVLGSEPQEAEKGFYRVGFLTHEVNKVPVSVRLLSTERDSLRMNGVKVNEIVNEIHYKDDTLYYYSLPNGYIGEYLIAFGEGTDTVYFKFKTE